MSNNQNGEENGGGQNNLANVQGVPDELQILRMEKQMGVLQKQIGNLQVPYGIADTVYEVLAKSNVEPVQGLMALEIVRVRLTSMLMTPVVAQEMGRHNQQFHTPKAAADKPQIPKQEVPKQDSADQQGATSETPPADGDNTDEGGTTE